MTRGSYIKLGKDGKPEQNGRPQFSNAQDKLLFEQIVYLSCVGEDGVLKDANEPKTVLNWRPGQPRQGVVDFGHMSGYEYDKLFQAYVEGVMPLDELKNITFNPAIYQLEAPGSNRSHKHEQK